MAAPAREAPPLRWTTPPPSSGHPVARRLLVGAVAGLVAAALVAIGRSSGLLTGVTGLSVAVLLVLLVPTSRELPRRVLLAGCLLLGWAPLSWWFALPFGSAGRVSAGLVVLAGALGFWAGSGRHPLARLRALGPRVRPVDLVLPATTALGVWTLWPWLPDRPSTEVLATLLRGWDHVAHFSMVHGIRVHGVTADVLAPPPGGETWQFASYPQGFHAAVAGAQELLSGPVAGDLTAELAGYGRGVAVVVVAAAVTVVAGVCALPGLRARPAVAAPAAAVAASVLLLGPGGAALRDGFGNFLVGCALVAAAALVALPMARVVRPLPLAALGGAVVGIATGWVLLLVLAVPVVLAVLLPLRRRRWAASAEGAAASIVLVVVVVAVLWRTATVVLRVQAVDPLLTPGGIAQPDLGLVLATACGLVVAAVAARGARVACLAAVPVLGVAVAVALGAAQITTNGEVSYYGLKFVTALEIVLPLLLLVPLTRLAARRRAPARPVRRAAAAVALALAATQVFGLAAPDGTDIGLAPRAPGAAARAERETVEEEPPTTADLARRVEAARPPAGRVYYLDLPSDGQTNPILAAQWYLALTGTWTLEANAVVSDITLSRGPLGVEFAAAVTRRILTDDPDAVVAVRPAYLRRLVEELGAPRLTPRIVTF